jgi:hypothetical protein
VRPTCAAEIAQLACQARCISHSTENPFMSAGRVIPAWLRSVQDCLHQFRRQQHQPERATKIGAVDLLGRGEFGGVAALHVLQQAPQSVRASDRPY